MRLLLDTCSIFYVSEQRRLLPEIVAHLDKSSRSGQLYVSLVSAWEIAMLASKGKTPITKHPQDYFESFLGETGAQLCRLDASIMIGSNYLPGRIHGDPMDRLLIESARSLNLTLVTSDRAILAYGAEGHVKTLAC
jgi:PIN domain nuclease of toxin-antitoxin system